MKLLSLVTTLSCTSVMAFSLGANAETLSSLQKLPNDRAIQNNCLDLPQSSNLAPNNPQNRDRTSSYSVFSLVKDQQITLDNLDRDLVSEDVEWYIEKFEHIDL